MKKFFFSLLVLTLPLVSFSQIIDNFSDNEFLNNPQWYGETSKFEVLDPPISGDGSINATANDDNFVLRSKQTLGDAVLTTLNPYAYGEWRFCVADGYNWSVSSSNDYIIILMSNDSTVSRLKDGVFNFNGYFLRFDGATSDQFTLYKQSGGTKTQILTTGYPASSDAAAAIGRTIKITRSLIGEWKIFIDEGFNVDPTTLRGSVIDNTITSSNFFAISTNISTTGSNSRVLYFDNLYIGPEIGDTIKPILSNLETISNNTLQLTFNEDLDSSSAVNILNYIVNNNVGNPKTATINLLDNKIVNLVFDSLFNDGQSNMITINNVSDTSGNSVSNLVAYFSYNKQKALSFDIISATQIDVTFSENPSVSTAQDVLNYSIDNSIGNPSTATIDGTNSKLIHLTFLNPLITKNYYNLSIENVSDLYLNPMDSSGFHFLYFVVSEDDIIVNEIFSDPTVSSGKTNTTLGTIGAEYIELYNTTSFDISVKNWTVTIGTNTPKTLTDYIIPANEYLIICTTGFEASYAVYGETMGLLSSSALTNAGTTIKIKNESSLLVNSVTYSDTWFTDAVKKDGGWSLEKIDPMNNCQGKENWIPSIDLNGGTPGIVNSVYATNIDTIKPQLLSVSALTINSLQVLFSENVSSSFSTSDFIISNNINPTSAVISSENSSIINLTFIDNFIPEQTDTLKIFNISDNCGNVLDSTKKSFLFYDAQENDVVINEFMPDPDPSNGLPISEYVELYNTKNFEISLNNWTLSIGGSIKTITNLSIPANGYAIVCPSGNENLFSSYGPVNGVLSSTALTMTGTNITLTDLKGLKINSIDYTVAWFNNTNKDGGGWSIEKIDPMNNCSGITNWKASENGNGGTPGAINSVNTPNIDNTNPLIKDVLVFTNTKLVIKVSETLSKDVAENLNNYFVTNSIGNPDSARIDKDDANLINLYFSNTFNSGDTNKIYFYNLKDLCGNPLIDTIIEFSYRNVNVYDIVINEFMADPEPVIELPNKEYVELYNTTNYDIDLVNWTITVGTTTKTIPPTKILTGEYLILCGASDSSIFEPYGKVAEISSFPSLGNTEGTITLKNMHSTIISTVTYTSDWYQSTYKDGGGWSLEQIDPKNPCGGNLNWIAAKDSKGGTPGAQNSVYAPNADNISPTLLRAVIYDTNQNKQLKLFFSEPLKLEKLSNLTNYTVSDTIYPISVFAIEPDYKSIILTFDSAFKANTLYTFTIIDTIYDCVGNMVSSENSSQFSVPDSVIKNDIIINEVLPNPYTGGEDYVEIYNRSNKYFDLKNLRIANVNSDNEIDNVYNISDESYLLFPKSYLVITKKPDVVKQQYFTEDPNAFIQITTMPTLNASSGGVVIADKQLNVIDSLVYDENMHYALLSSTKGVSLERINFERATLDKTNWHSASQNVGFGTPGYKNSQYSESLSADENSISISPEAFSPDNDGFDDVLNINYKFDGAGYKATIAIYDLKGRLVKTVANNELMAIEGVYTWDGICESGNKANVGMYVLYFEAFNLDGNVIKKKLPVVVSVKF